MKATTSIVIRRAGGKDVLCIREGVYSPVPIDGKMVFEYVYTERDEIVLLTLRVVDIHDVLRPHDTSRVITVVTVNAQRKKIKDDD